VYDQFLESLGLLIRASRKEERSLAIGIDANAVVGSRLRSDDPACIGQDGAGVRNHRGHCFSSWCQEHRLSVVSTMLRKQSDLLWTQRAFATGVKRQIDYFLVDSIVRGSAYNVLVLDPPGGKSDHRIIGMRMKLSAWKTRRSRCKGFSARGWKPRLDEQGEPSEYHLALDEGLEIRWR